MKMNRLQLGLAVVMLGLWVSACGIPKEKYDRQVALANQLHKRLNEMKQEKEGLTKKVSELENELAQIKNAMSGMKGQVAAGAKSQAELERLRKIMEQEKALNARLTAAFRGMIKAGQLRVENINGRLVIKMASQILFRSGKADLTRLGKNALSKIGGILKKVDRHFQVAGHTDNQPIKRSKKYKDNWDLSAMRAIEVVRILRKVGVPGDNVSAAAFSQFQPAKTNRTVIGRRLNRRIEITLLPLIPKRVK